MKKILLRKFGICKSSGKLTTAYKLYKESVRRVRAKLAS
jgi:hypothetical protein